MKRLALAAALSAAFGAQAGTLGQNVYANTIPYASCLSGQVPTPVSAQMTTTVAGHYIQANWGVMASAYGLKWELWWCAGATCTNYAKVAQWPDTTVPTTNNQDWIACIDSLGCYLNSTQGGTYRTGGMTANTHKFQLRYTQWAGATNCTYFSNRWLELQEIIP